MKAMQTYKSAQWKYVIFFFTGWVVLSCVLSWSGLFGPSWFAAYGFLGAILIAYFRHQAYTFIHDNALLIVVSALLAIGFSSLIHQQTFFSGRDQGSLSLAAIELAQGGKLYSSFPAQQEFFMIYGPGKALNFPGFFYTHSGNLTSQFPLPTIAWYASFFAIFGLLGFSIANSLLLFLFFVSFVLLGISFVGKRHLPIFFLLLASACTTYWFFRFTLSENMMVAFVWMTLWLLILPLRAVQVGNQSKQYIFFLTLLIILLPLIRIEGFFMAAIAFVIVWANSMLRSTLLQHRAILYLSLAVGISLLVINAAFSLPFYKTIAKALMESSLFTHTSPKNLVTENPEITFSLFSVLFLYGLLPVIIIGVGAIVAFSKRNRKDIPRFFPFLISFPSFAYVVHSFISLDHPWMLRRFAFAFIPCCAWYAALFIGEMKNSQKIRLTLVASLLFWLIFLSHIIVMGYLFPAQTSTNLLQETERLSNSFHKDDLVLVDRLASGDPHAMLAGPMHSLFGLNAVYFFNPNDAFKISRERFPHVFLLVPEDALETYRSHALWNRMKPEREFILSYNRFRVPPDTLSLPRNEHINRRIFIFSVLP